MEFQENVIVEDIIVPQIFKCEDYEKTTEDMKTNCGLIYPLMNFGEGSILGTLCLADEMNENNSQNWIKNDCLEDIKTNNDKNFDQIQVKSEPSYDLDSPYQHFNLHHIKEEDLEVDNDILDDYDIKEEVLNDQPEFVSVNGFDQALIDDDVNPKVMEVHTFQIPEYTNNIMYQCRQCDFAVPDMKTLRYHIDEHHLKALRCPLCNFRCYTAKNLGLHVQGKHRIKNTSECPYCDFSTDVPANLKCHLNSKHASLVLYEQVTKLTFYKCGKCDFKAPQLAALKNHLSVKHLQCVYECPYCQNKYPSISTLAAHVAKHSSTKVYKCRECEFITFDLPTLKTHFGIEHTKQSYKCQGCSEIFTTQNSLESHLNTYHRVYTCRYCSFKGTGIEELTNHYSMEHKNIFYCPYCPYKGKMLNVVKQHISEIHRKL